MKKGHIILIVFGAAFLFAYLTSGKKKEVAKAPVKEETKKEPAATIENNPIVTGNANSNAGVIRQPNFAPSYVPRPAKVGPTPGVVGTTLAPEYYNPYQELTDQMRSRRQNPEANAPQNNNQRNLYFETLSQQLKDLQGNKEKPATPSPTGALERGASPARQAGSVDVPDFETAPVDPIGDEEIIDDSVTEITDEELEEILDNRDDGELIDAEIEQILREEGY